MPFLAFCLLVVAGLSAAFAGWAKGRAGLCPRRAAGRRGAVCGTLLVAVFNADGLVDMPDDGTPTEAEVAYTTAAVLAQAQFSHRPLDAQLSSRFLDGFLDALDGSHLLFRQSDVDEFGWFRPELTQMIVSEGDTWPAHVIYARFLRRLAQQVSFETNFLRTAKFDFAGHDSWQPDRHALRYPRDTNAACALWREAVRADYLQEKLAGLPPSKIVPRLSQRYERRLETMRQLEASEVLEIYLDAFARAFDPHSNYFGHEAAQEFNAEVNLSLAGIGGSLEAKGGYWVVGSLIPGGPAARSGLLHPGDRIVGIAQGDHEPEDVTALPWWHVVNLIRGPKGTTVRLTLIPAGQSSAARKTVSLVRENVSLSDEYAQAAIVDLPQASGAKLRVGIVNLPIFYQKNDPNDGGASADTARLLKRLKREGITGLILDLRRNRGGLLPEAVGLAGLFIPAGPVVQTLDSTGRLAVERSPDTNALYAGPLVVLTSRLSASSSEIVAGALQDYGRALIVGDSSTFGKGTVQNLVSLRKILHHSGFGAVKVTVAKFYRPSGASTQLRGVTPDIVLPSETDLPSIGEARLPNALPWDSVRPTVYTNFDWVRPVLSALRDKSRARVASDPGFGLMRAEVAAATAEAAQPLSLNETARRRAMARADEFTTKLQALCRSDSTRRPPTYDLTLANVDTEGLPLARPPSPPTADASPSTENGPEDDIVLCEAEHILADYIQLLQAVVRDRPAAPAQPK